MTTDGAEGVRRRAGGGRRQGSGRRTRERLLRAARRIGAGTPFSRITIEQITDRAGTSRATFYLYFPNKDEIYLELAREACDRLFEAANAGWHGMTPPKSLEVSMRGYVSEFMDNSDVLRLLYTIAPSDERFGSLVKGVHSRFQERVKRNLDRGIERGFFREMNTVLVARALGGMVENFCVESIADEAEVDIDHIVDVLTDVFYHAISVRGS